VEAARWEKRYIRLWGTGTATREFLHANDAARGILLAAEHYNKPEPVNLGTGNEISIADLASKIAALTGFTGDILWDAEQPDGQPRRVLDTTRAKLEFGFQAAIPLEDGLRQTIDWYISNP
jgi:GDP-L-fucose synthase